MIGRIIAGRYEIKSLIGTGGMANVYMAYDMQNDCIVALKMLKDEHKNDGEFLRRFEREAQAVLMLSHPNIVSSYDVGSDGNLHYIALEYVEGDTLKEIIKKQGTLSPKVAIGIACQVLDALQRAHECGIIHRDVKPQNVIITLAGKAKLTDFGIARDASSTTRTFAGTSVIGSVHYISPEQAKGDNVTEESDVYSCAIMLYEMLTGEVPFSGDNSVAIAIKHLQEEIAQPIRMNPKIPRSLSDVIVKAASKAPGERYQSAAQMKRDLMRSLRDPYGRFARKGASAREKKNSHTKGIFRIAMAIIIILGIFSAMFLMMSSRREAEQSTSDYIVPMFVGKTLDAAQELAELRGFKLSVLDYVENDEYPAGQIASQTPVSGTIGKEWDVITVEVSSGTGYLIVPKLVGSTLKDALVALSEGGLNVGEIQYCVSDLYADGQIIKQEPEFGTQAYDGDKVDIWICGTESKTIDMPLVTDSAYDDALETLSSYGFENILVRVVTPEKSNNEEIVQKQSPAAGMSVSREEHIELWVARTYLGRYASDIAINLETKQNNQDVVVTALTKDGAELVLYETTIQTAAQTTVSFTGYMQTEGEYTCKVYVGGEEVKQITASFTVH